MVLSVLHKIKFEHGQIIVPKIGTTMSKQPVWAPAHVTQIKLNLSLPHKAI